MSIYTITTQAARQTHINDDIRAYAANHASDFIKWAEKNGKFAEVKRLAHRNDQRIYFMINDYFAASFFVSTLPTSERELRATQKAIIRALINL